jgi:hypothetical protein
VTRGAPASSGVTQRPRSSSIRLLCLDPAPMLSAMPPTNRWPARRRGRSNEPCGRTGAHGCLPLTAGHRRRCPTGEARVTPGFRMNARWIIHAVGPIHRGVPDHARLLASAIRAALDAAVEHGARAVALPALSCGAFGYRCMRPPACAHDSTRSTHRCRPARRARSRYLPGSFQSLSWHIRHGWSPSFLLSEPAARVRRGQRQISYSIEHTQGPPHHARFPDAQDL